MKKLTPQKVHTLLNLCKHYFILFHKSNNALKELKGCIAPVAEQVAPGIGKRSFTAFQELMHHVLPLFEKGEQPWLHVTKLSDRYAHVS